MPRHRRPGLAGGVAIDGTHAARFAEPPALAGVDCGQQVRPPRAYSIVHSGGGGRRRSPARVRTPGA
ncbi:hypothetical protein ACFH04_07310 [Streptomyces noboritoensis]|uniref:Uncharacterized protein n=1 Tax=Streptomyces noboritoensis TaxID=67337 RepID=A0ABV6TCK6_9ACTN